MTNDLTPAQAEDIKHRLRMRFAVALAEAEAAEMQADQGAEILHFLPRAAATGDLQLLSKAEAENDDSIAVRFSERAETIEVNVETSGFYRIGEVEGRRALMRSQNDLVHYEFAFDSEGCAAFSLQNRPGVVEALLQGWTILIAPKI